MMNSVWFLLSSSHRLPSSCSMPPRRGGKFQVMTRMSMQVELLVQIAEIVDLVLPIQRPKRQGDCLSSSERPFIIRAATYPFRRQDMEVLPTRSHPQPGGLEKLLPFE